MNGTIPDGYLADGLIVFGGPAGGIISAGFQLDMPNFQSAAHAVCNQGQDAISAALRQLPEGMNLQVIQHRSPANLKRLLDYQEQTEKCRNATTRMLRNANFIHQWELRDAGKLLENQVLLYASRPNPLGSSAGVKNTEERYARYLDGARASFKELEQSLDQALRQIGGRVTPLGDEDNARLWAQTFNPSLAGISDYDPVKSFDPTRSLLENFWNSELRGRGRQGFVFDGYLHLALAVRRLPTTTHPNIIHRLAYPPFGEFAFTVQLSRLRKEDVIRRTQFSLDRLHQHLLRKPDERQAVTQRQLQEKIHRLASGEAVPLEMEIIFLLRAKTEEELADKAAALKANLQSMNGAQYYEATLPSTSRNLFAKTIPGWTGSRHDGFRHYCEDRTATDMLPLCSTFAGHPGAVQALFPGNDNNMVNAAMFLGEGDAATPQNLGVLGTTGAGKSLAAAKLLSETDYIFGFTAIVEEGRSQTSYTRSHGGEPIDFRIDGMQTLNPLDTQALPRSAFVSSTQSVIITRMLGLPANEDEARRLSALVSRHLDRLSNEHADDQLAKWPLEKRNQIVRHALALHLMGKKQGVSQFEAFGEFNELRREKPAEADDLLAGFSQDELDEFENTNAQSVRNLVFAYLRPDEHLTLSSLCEHFELATEDEEQSRWLATLLTPWCRDGNYGVLFDGTSNVSLDGPVVHFELGFIPESAKEIKAVIGLIIINWLRNRVLTLPRHVKKRVVIDELSRFLNVPGGDQILRELLEQFRKFRTQVILIFQQYARIADTPLRAAIVGNLRAWFIFTTGDPHDIEHLCEDLGLSSAARDAILRYPRPDQQTGAKYSEFLYFHTDARQPICGTARYVRLPHELPSSTPTHHA
jgi:hypothetical protein